MVVRWLFWFIKWWLIISVLSLVVFAILITWDWFWFRQLPWLKWRATQEKQSLTRNVLEMAHIPTPDAEDEAQQPDIVEPALRSEAATLQINDQTSPPEPPPEPPR
jgi:hypothetical protein